MIWNTKLILVAATVISTLSAGAAWYAHSKGRQSGMQQVQTLWDSEKLATSQAQAEELMKARQREQALAKLMDRQRKEHQNEVNRVVREYAALSDSLRDRPERPADSAGGVPEGAGAGTEPAAGCTGAELYRADSEVLVGIARDADQLRLALKACVGAYDAARREVNGD
jgi:hypothetical protein